MLKIATVTEEGRFGGPQRWISSVSGKLKDFGFDQIVIFPTLDSDRFYEELGLQGISTKRIPLHRLTKEKTHLIKFILLFFPEIVLLFKLFKKEGVDIVHCNNSWQFKGVIAGKLAGKKIVWHLHETSTPFFVNIVFKFLASYFCDTFITAGTRVKSYYINGPRFAQKQIVEIQAPVDTVIFDPKKVVYDPAISAYSGLKIVTVGNINPTKGVEYFIEMASILNQRYDNLSFLVVGPHLDSQRVYSDKIVGLMKKYDLKNLHFCGSSENIPSILKAADVYVCSSIAEASPISVWEAMSMEKAIVSTDVGDVAKFIKDGVSGYIVPIKNALAMAEKVGLLIENKALRKKVGGNARKVAVKNLDVDICTKKQAEFYRKIMGKH
jgi:glycosyltransferase involved in cell wall biosynthesis